MDTGRWELFAPRDIATVQALWVTSYVAGNG